ncbi:glycosyltransferase family 4 protein [Niallia taxi]|uniref:glycosyltransferase family 4 protein n=1 Tax=Niallia taxi TaxID=2499688 RepID=UPI0011A66ED7|nr:glycosyltransferase family 4 protein [Niallia taxi]WOD63556.1 glycosyltransferase family 4 protein [Niallia taxi]
MKNMLQLIDRSNSNGGAQKHTLLITKEFAKKGYNVWLACPPGDYVEEFRKLEKYGVEIIVVDMNKSFFKSLLELRAIVLKNEISIIHSHLLKSDFLSALIKISIGKKLKVITTIHNILSEDVQGLKKIIYTQFAKFSFKYIDKAFSVSKDVRDTTIKYFSLKEEKVMTVLNGIDTEQYENIDVSSSSKRKELGISQSDFVITCAGALIERKGQQVLIEALKMTKYKVKLLLLGSGENEDFLSQKIDNYGLKDQVVLLGHRSDVLEIINESDIYVQPSLWDPLPRAMLEAMGLGIASIGSNVNGIPEVITHLETGLLVNPNDPIDLKNKIEILIEDNTLRKDISKKGKEFILKNCTTSRMCKEIELSISL